MREQLGGARRRGEGATARRISAAPRRIASLARCARRRLLAQSRRRSAGVARARSAARAQASATFRTSTARLRPRQGVTEVLVYAAIVRACSRAWRRRSPPAAPTSPTRACTPRRTARRSTCSRSKRPSTSRSANGHPDVLAALIARVTSATALDQPRPRASPPLAAPRRSRSSRGCASTTKSPPHATVIEASGRDRLGLLAELAHVFADAGVSIVSAHIDTYGERASDVFYVQEDGGGQIARSARASRRLQAELEAVLARRRTRRARRSGAANPWRWRAPRRRGRSLRRCLRRRSGNHMSLARNTAVIGGLTLISRAAWLRARLAAWPRRLAPGRSRTRSSPRCVSRTCSAACSPKARSARRSCRCIQRRSPRKGRRPPMRLPAKRSRCCWWRLALLTGIAMLGMPWINGVLFVGYADDPADLRAGHAADADHHAVS